MISVRSFSCLFPLCLSVVPVVVQAEAGGMKIVRVLDVCPVWSGHPVGFCLLTEGEHQFAAFYDAERRMTVASRKTDAEKWHLVRLPEKIGWDSHNYITMAVDADGCLHLSGNMHGSPLVYFRTAKPYDIDTFERIAHMVGEREKRATYPRFLRGPKNELVFNYRDGGSGNGCRLWNVYDPKAKRWRRLIDQPLLSGQGKMNAYPQGPLRDANGTYHICWVWRDTPDCATNHDLSYARSVDLVHWTTSAGKPLALPITIETAEIVDPVPAGGGMINSNIRLGFDTKNRPVIGYHKFDADGNTQAYNARLEDGQWRICQTSDWSYRWYFQGGGSIGTELGFGAVAVQPDGKLSQSYHHTKEGSGIWHLDEKTLKPIGKIKKASRYPKELGKVESKVPGMRVRRCHSTGRGGIEYILKWETLGPNRDRPRKDSPPPSMLRLYELRAP